MNTMNLLNRGAVVAMALLFVSAFPKAQKYAAPFPRGDAKQRLDNERVTIWDVALEPGRRTDMCELPLDQVSVSLSDAAVKVTRPDGVWSIEQRRVGSVRLDSKGSIYAEEGIGDTPTRSIVVALKPYAAPKVEIKNGIPGQFPRPGSTKLFENDRITVWDHTWRPGVPRREHLHYTQVVGVFVEPGATRSYPADGTPAVALRKVGDVNFSSYLKSPHSEEVAEGLPRAIFIELK